LSRASLCCCCRPSAPRGWPLCRCAGWTRAEWTPSVWPPPRCAGWRPSVCVPSLPPSCAPLLLSCGCGCGCVGKVWVWSVGVGEGCGGGCGCIGKVGKQAFKWLCCVWLCVQGGCGERAGGNSMLTW
jgi:hypothetical protein